MNHFKTKEMYESWLLEKVLIHCWSTYKCAKFIGADPHDVLCDFNRLIIKLKRKKNGR